MEKEKLRDEVEAVYKWDLSKIYKTKEEIETDITLVQDLTKEMLTYKDHLMDNSTVLQEATDKYFNLMRIIDKLVVYSEMKFHEDMQISENEALTGKISKMLDEISEKLAFYTPELLKHDYKDVEKYIEENKNLKKYQFTFEKLFREKEHVLSLKEEEMMARLGEVFSIASDTFHMIDDVNLSFDNIKNEKGQEVELTNSNYTNFLKSKDRNVRKAAFNSLYKSYMQFKNTFASLLKGNIKSNFFVSKTRKYNSPLEMYLFDDYIDKKLYLELIEKVNKNLDINHDYMKVRKKILGLDSLHMYDVYAPLVDNIAKEYSYEEAKEIVINALKPLGEDYIKNLTYLFDNNCIDVFHNKNKRSGAYSWGSYDTMPYVLLNFEGEFNDVSTIAHELGHSMHSLYSNKNRPYHDHGYPIFLAEIASTVNEILLNKYCSENAKTKEEKAYYLNNLLEMFRSTLIRQTMFAEFELKIHDLEEEGESLTEELISNTYYEINKKYFGEDVISDDEIKVEWARIPHFYTSFYVFKYATGISAAAKIAGDILEKKEGALENYIEFLSSGGSDYPLEILKKVGIDMANDDTIDKALDMFKNTLEEFKKLT